MTVRLAPLLLAAALAGGAAGWAISHAVAETYEAAATLQVLPVGESAAEGSPAAQVQAASLAALVDRRSFAEGIRPQVQGGRLSTDELVERVAGRHLEGTAVAEVVAEGPSRQAARGLASDVASALVAYARRNAEQRQVQVEDELRRRLDQLAGELAEAESEERAESLRQERDRLTERLGSLAASGVEEGTRVVLAGPAAVAGEPVGPDRLLFAASGAAIGLLAAAVGLLARTPAAGRLAGAPARESAPAGPEAEPEPEPEAVQPEIVEPRAGAVLTGEVALRVLPAGSGVEVSREGAEWRALAADGTWDTAGLDDGRYLLRTRGSDHAVPVHVDNTPPTVRLLEPERAGSLFRFRAEASDAGSGVASVGYMASDGAPDWVEIPAEWEPPAPGLWWVCAVAGDWAGHRAASEPVAVRVASL